MGFIVVVLGLSFLFAPEPQAVDWEEVNFSTTSSSVLYFKNVRSYYYYIDAREKAPFVLYRLKRGSHDTLQPAIRFMIIENTPAGEAYIFAEPNAALLQFDSVRLGLPAGNAYEREEVLLNNLNNEGHFQLAARVYARLLKHEQIYLMSRKDTIRSLYSSKRKRLNAETVLEDYFNLVNKN